MPSRETGGSSAIAAMDRKQRSRCAPSLKMRPFQAQAVSNTPSPYSTAWSSTDILAEQDPETGRFFIGVKMLSWATAARDRFSLVRLVEPALLRISRQTQDTIYLVVRSGDDIVCLDCREGSFPIKVLTLNVGDRRP